MALLSQALHALASREVQYLYGRTIRRNARALSFGSRMGFEWVMTREILLGKDLNRGAGKPEPSAASSLETVFSR